VSNQLFKAGYNPVLRVSNMRKAYWPALRRLYISFAFHLSRPGVYGGWGNSHNVMGSLNEYLGYSILSGAQAKEKGLAMGNKTPNPLSESHLYLSLYQGYKDYG
jgi:hypothetical protein